MRRHYKSVGVLVKSHAERNDCWRAIMTLGAFFSCGFLSCQAGKGEETETLVSKEQKKTPPSSVGKPTTWRGMMTSFEAGLGEGAREPSQTARQLGGSS